MSEITQNHERQGGSASQKKRLVVLGAGPSALSALYHITDREEFREQYDITVYQMGWRAGGKGVSGRGEHGRILEHGLHILFGFYENFFSMIRKVYPLLKRPAGRPLATWRDAFKGHDFGVVMEFFKGEWRPWQLEFPTNESTPGDGGAWDTEDDYVSMLVQALFELILGWRALRKATRPHEFFHKGAEQHTRHWSDLPVSLIMGAFMRIMKRHLRKQETTRRNRSLHSSVTRFGNILWPLIRKWSEQSFASHRFWLGCDFIFACLKGVISDEVWKKDGFNEIDGYDFRQWLTKHGLHEITLASPYCRTIYDAAFSYERGDPAKQSVAAGAALRALFRMGFTYKGHAYYKMQAGMGDTVFAPIYMVLKQRGVKFKFFHKVESLHLSPATADGSPRSVTSVRITRQAKLSNRRSAEDYDPLVNVADLECWPAEPKWAEIENAGAYLKSNNPNVYYDLESYYERLPSELTEQVTLREGEDYDQLLYAIPIGAVPYLCEELVKDNKAWSNMVQHVKSVQTVAFQLWFTRDLKQLGWNYPSPLLSLYVEPLNTWADMSQVISRETWPQGSGPLNISYYCGPQQGPDLAPDPRDPANSNFETQEYAKAKDLSLEFCKNSFGPLMPNAVDPEQPPELDWSLLLDLQGGRGEQRFGSQYWRSNCGPSERCTLALPGATRFRMKPGESGYANLVVTGDWTDNRLYVACMEGAITSGIYAARAITGYNFPIIGEKVNDS